jgi:hypothetical protein
MAPRDHVEVYFRVLVPGPAGEAVEMLVPPPTERFDLADARFTDALLRALRGEG